MRNKYEVYVQGPDGRQLIGTTPYQTLVQADLEVLKEPKKPKVAPEAQSTGVRKFIKTLFTYRPSSAEQVGELVNELISFKHRETMISLRMLAMEADIPQKDVENASHIARTAHEQLQINPTSGVIFELQHKPIRRSHKRG